MGTIITLTGPSGSGKTTIAGQLLRRLPNACMVPSYTTRSMRASDLSEEYTYTSRKHLRRLDSDRRLAWIVQHGEHIYATIERDIVRVLHNPHKLGIMILVPNILPKLRNIVERERGPDSWLPLFVRQPPADLLQERLTPERQKEVESRKASEEGWPEIARDYAPHMRLVTNDGPLDETISTVLALLPNGEAAP